MARGVGHTHYATGTCGEKLKMDPALNRTIASLPLAAVLDLCQQWDFRSIHLLPMVSSLQESDSQNLHALSIIGFAVFADRTGDQTSYDASCVEPVPSNHLASHCPASRLDNGREAESLGGQARESH